MPVSQFGQMMRAKMQNTIQDDVHKAKMQIQQSTKVKKKL